MIAKCPNGCEDNTFVVDVEVATIQQWCVASDGECLDIYDKEEIAGASPFYNTDWECTQCGEKATFVEG